MNKLLSERYGATNLSVYSTSLKRSGGFLLWLDLGMQWTASAGGKPGRPATFSDTAIEFCLTVKSLFGMPLRQTVGFVEKLLRLVGVDWRVPDFSTLSRRQDVVASQIPSQNRGECLHLLVDRAGVKVISDDEWQAKKEGAGYRHEWRKLYLGGDAQTGEICALEVSDDESFEASVLPVLLAQIPEEKTLASKK